jgi:hypothetical protein
MTNGRQMADTPDRGDEFLEFLNQPAEDDPHDEIAAFTQFAVCPNCAAEYPDFHSPAGSMGTLCDNCGWSSDEGKVST